MSGKIINYLESLPSPVILELYDYIHTPNYKLVEWVPLEKLDLQVFLYNKHPGAVDVLLKEDVVIDIAYVDGYRISRENPRIEELEDKLGITKQRRSYFSDCNVKRVHYQNITNFSYDEPDPNILVENCIYPDSKFVEIIGNNKDRLTEDSWLKLSRIFKSNNLLLFLEKNIDKLDVYCIRNICNTPSDETVERLILPIIGRLDTECWENICRNAKSEKAIDLILNNFSHVNIECLEYLCENDNPKILQKISEVTDSFDTECWNSLCLNRNQLIVDIIEKNLGIFPLQSWEKLCSNYVVDSYRLIKQNIDKLDDICWGLLSKNSNDNILLEIIAKNIYNLQHRICWFNVWNGLLRQNTNPISLDILKSILPIMTNNILFWKNLSSSTHIFTIDREVTDLFRIKWYSEINKFKNS